MARTTGSPSCRAWPNSPSREKLSRNRSLKVSRRSRRRLNPRCDWLALRRRRPHKRTGGVPGVCPARRGHRRPLPERQGHPVGARAGLALRRLRPHNEPAACRGFAQRVEEIAAPFPDDRTSRSSARGPGAPPPTPTGTNRRRAGGLPSASRRSPPPSRATGASSRARAGLALRRLRPHQ